ncbi:MAG: hypothetical protein JWP82_2227 [Humibacillus sp.]|nr:hypothetical protein [Humibacillus sp.]
MSLHVHHRQPAVLGGSRLSSRLSLTSPTLQATALAALALALVGVGAALPWLTLFNGLTPLPGFRLDGGDLSGLAVLSAGLLAVAARHGAGRVLRALAVLGALVVLAGALSSARTIATYVADPGPGGVLAAPTRGPGAIVMAAGGVLLLAAALRMPVRRTPLGAALLLRVVLAVATFVAGWMHLVLTPEHLAESTVLGLGFLGAGVAQVALAVLVVEGRSETTLSILVALDVALLAVWAYAVLVGLPLAEAGGHDHGGEAAGLVIGHGEPIDLAAAVTKLAELTSLALAFVVLRAVTLRHEVRGALSDRT